MTTARQLALTSITLELMGVLLLLFVIAASIGADNASARPILSNSTLSETREYSPAVIHGKPVHVSLPSLGISTDVDDGYYDNTSSQWTITEDAAFFATISDEINAASGSTFIYGHNSDKIFGKLRDIKQGAQVKVRTDNGYTFVYSFTSKEDVAPTDADKLEYSGKPRLVLQTCSGFWNQTRQLTYFTLESYTKN